MKITLEFELSEKLIEDAHLDKQIIREKLKEHVEEALAELDQHYDGLAIDCSDDGDKTVMNFYNIDNIK